MLVVPVLGELAAPIVVLVWAGGHAFVPLLIREGSLDVVFAGS